MPSVDFTKIIEMSEEKLELPVVSGDHIQSRCPFCGDSKTKPKAKRFHIDFYPPYDNYIGKCFRCGESCNVISLYSFLYDVSYTHAKYALEGRKFDPEKLNERTKGEIERKQESVTIEESHELDINIEKECYSVDSQPSGRIGKRYVEALKKFEEERKVEGCFVAHSGKYKGRVIIPIYNDGKLVYFQGRALFDWAQPKYLNPEVDKENIILNKDRFDPDKSIIVTEGILDALTIGDQGTSPLGVSINDELLFQLRGFTNRNVILALDNHRKDDASLHQLKKIAEKSTNKKIIKYFLFPKEHDVCKDINDLVALNKINKNEVFDYIVDNSCSFERMLLLIKFGG